MRICIVPFSIVVLMSDLVVQHAAGADAQLIRIADFYDEAVSDMLLSSGQFSTSISHLGDLSNDASIGTEIRQRIISPPFYLFRIGDDPDGGSASYNQVMMINDQYVAGITREKNSSRWLLKFLAFPDDAKYKELSKRSFEQEHPAYEYLRAGPSSWIPSELRTGDVLDSQQVAIDGVAATKWSVNVTVRNALGNVVGDITREYTIEATEPYRMFHFSYPLFPVFTKQEVRYTDWHSFLGFDYPMTQSIYNTVDSSEQAKLGVQARHEVTQGTGDFRAEMAFLTYYGLDEPGGRRSPFFWTVLLLPVVAALLIWISQKLRPKES